MCDTHTTISFPDKIELVIGRRDQFGRFKPDIDLADQGGDEKGVSREHALLFWQDDQVYIQDLGSSNGTYVNQQQLRPQQPHPLRDRDAIWLGHMKLIYQI